MFLVLVAAGWLLWFVYLFYTNQISRSMIAIEWPVTITWYGLFLSIGGLLGLVIANYWRKIRGLDYNQFINLVVIALIAGIIGSRLVYVVLNFEFYRPHLGEILTLSRGGLSIHGAIAFGLIAIWAWARIKKIKILPYFDVMSIGLLIGQIIGRLGNLFNQELVGPPTNLPWRLYVNPDSRPAQYLASDYFHPYFLYEIIGNLILLAVLWRILKKKLPPGRVFTVYLVGYSAARFVAEFWRVNQGIEYLGLSLSQLVSAIIILIGIFWFFTNWRRQY